MCKLGKEDKDFFLETFLRLVQIESASEQGPDRCPTTDGQLKVGDALIDIMEYVGREPDLVIGTAHGPGYSGALGMSRWNRQTYDIADDFHTYAIEWEAGQIKWFYDGAEYFTLTRADLSGR